MKIKLELVIHDNGTTYLNYWDSIGGKDVTGQVEESVIYMGYGDGQLEGGIDLSEFIDKVKQVVDNQ